MMENGSADVTRSPEDVAKEFQAYLRKYENDDKLVILEAVQKPGSKLGDNYTSIMIRTKLRGTRGDGSPYTKACMTKVLKNRKISSLIDPTDLFCIEAHTYRKVLPFLGDFGPQCIHADNCTIIMEDLAEKGYVICERRNYLDLDHTVYALKKLAKLHASALAIKLNRPKQFDMLNMNIEEIIYKDNSNTSVMRSCTEAIMKAMLQYLDTMEPRTQELQAVRDYLDAHVATAYDITKRLFTGPKHKYDTICHGDPWINNLLFLHDKDGKIVDLKMVDYQIIRYTSLTTDILYFIYSSVRSSLIEKSFNSLIKIYHNEFITEFGRLRVDEMTLAELGMEWLETELRNNAFYGLLIGCFFINPILAEDEDVQQFETIDFGPANPMYQADMNPALNQKKINRVKTIVFHYYKRLYLGIIDDDVEPIPVKGHSEQSCTKRKD